MSAITPNPHTNLLNVYIQIANKMGFQKKKSLIHKQKLELLAEIRIGKETHSYDDVETLIGRPSSWKQRLIEKSVKKAAEVGREVEKSQQNQQQQQQ
jgi:hypothetical protein